MDRDNDAIVLWHDSHSRITADDWASSTAMRSVRQPVVAVGDKLPDRFCA